MRGIARVGEIRNREEEARKEREERGRKGVEDLRTWMKKTRGREGEWEGVWKQNIRSHKHGHIQRGGAIV